MRKILISGLLLLLHICMFAHPWKPDHYVIIDTDGGIDDIRAISLLLASPAVRVLGIISSPGVLSADDAYIKVKSLLNSFYHEGLPVGINRNITYKAGNSPAAKDYRWGEETGIDPDQAPDFIHLISEVFTFEKTKVTYICLGGMSSAEEAMRKIPEFRTQVKAIVWSCSGLKDTKGFNYNIDKSSSTKVLNQEIPVKAVTSLPESDFFDQKLMELLSTVNTPYAKKIVEFSGTEISKNHSFTRKANDELVPLFLHFPDLFKSSIAGISSENVPLNLQGLREACIKVLEGATAPKNQVIKELPLSPSFYMEDIEPSVNEITEKYGTDEWIAGVIANELHRHLGVFAIIGVKMGIRAREYFNTGVDEFRVTSFAGSMPPLSCMNDGIQVSTGATPGHGLLTISTDTLKIASCEFTYLNHKIRLTLESGIASKISGELKEINFVYGLDSDLYWELVRKNSIKYWKELDRHEIFIIERL